jgi:hypothetical protein
LGKKKYSWIDSRTLVDWWDKYWFFGYIPDRKRADRDCSTVFTKEVSDYIKNLLEIDPELYLYEIKKKVFDGLGTKVSESAIQAPYSKDRPQLVYTFAMFTCMLPHASNSNNDNYAATLLMTTMQLRTMYVVLCTLCVVY